MVIVCEECRTLTCEGRKLVMGQGRGTDGSGCVDCCQCGWGVDVLVVGWEIVGCDGLGAGFLA